MNPSAPPGVHLIRHPILQHHLSNLRRKETRPTEFRRLMTEMSKLIAYEVTRDQELRLEPIETPFEAMDAPFLAHRMVVVSIMRAGNGMLEGVLQAIPNAGVGHIGIYRDKFIHSTVEYFFRLPADVEGRAVLLLDPLLATGATAVAAIARLKQYGVGPIRFVCLLASPEGLALVKEAHPDVDVACLSIERQLNEKGYILPGLGDAGDRLYNTV